MWRLGSRYAHISYRAVPGFNSLDRVHKRLFQDTFADSSDYQAEQPSLEVLAIPYGDKVNVGQAVRAPREGLGVAGCASPRVGIGRCEDYMDRIGPIVVQAFPDATRALRDVGLRGSSAMDFEVLVGTVAKKFRATGPEVGKPSDVLLRRGSSCLVHMDCGHALLRLLRKA